MATAKGNEIIEAARAHFASRLNSNELDFVEVPEWGTPDSPARIYYKPMNLEQQNKIYQYVAQNSLESIAQTIITRARDEDGRRMFADAHKLYFMKEVDPAVMTRIVTEMAGDEDIDEGEAVKN